MSGISAHECSFYYVIMSTCAKLTSLVFPLRFYFLQNLTTILEFFGVEALIVICECNY